MAHIMKITKGCTSPEYGKLNCSQCWMKDTNACMKNRVDVVVEEPYICSDHRDCIRRKRDKTNCEWCDV